MPIRIIPRLDIKGTNLVKGVHLEGLRVLGKPEDFSRFYYENGADELLYMDVVASLYGRNNLLEILERTAKETFIPLTVGGGIRTVDDIRNVLKSGADKVALNTAAISNPEFIKIASNKFGSSTIVVSIEAIRKSNGSYEAFVDSGREPTGNDPLNWAVRAAELGAGEIIITSINQEGTGKGFDIELIRSISESVSIPVVACGGAGTVQDIHDALTLGKADAVSIASIVHYSCMEKFQYSSAEFQEEGNIEFLARGAPSTNITGASVQQIKNYLISNDIDCKPA